MDSDKQMREVLESEACLGSLSRMCSDFYWETDAEHRISLRGAGGRQSPVSVFKHGPQLGKRRWEIPYLSPDEAGWQAHRAVLDAHLPFRDFELSRPTEGGAARHFSISGDPVFDVSGAFKGYRGVGTDISERKRAEGESRRFRMAMDASMDSIYLTDLSTMRFVYVNDAACRRLGYARKRLLAMGPQDVIRKDFAALRREYDEVIAANGQGMTVEHRFVASDGREGWTEVHRRALIMDEGPLIVSIARDITGRKEDETRIRRLNRMYAVLSGINGLIVRAQDRDGLFREACRIAVEAGLFKAAWIGTVDRDIMKIIPVASAGISQPYMAMLMKHFSIADDAASGGFLARQAVREKKIAVANDMQDRPGSRLRTAHLENGIRAIAVLPLVVADAAVAVMCLQSDEAGFFDAEELRLLAELGGDLSFALDHIAKANRLDYLAYYDALTGLANRALFHERLTQHVYTAQQRQGSQALALLDVERFKTINDSLGRHAGDALLKELAARLERAADAARVARVGADQFSILLPEGSASEAGRKIETIWQACFAQPFRINDGELRVAARTGIALYPGDGANAEALLAAAEAALRKAKQTGERHQFHSPELTAGVADKLKLENRLRQALEREEFVLHYQPKIELDTKRIVGVEALIRWQSPELGLVPPVKFIPLMEETGLILEVGTWALRRAAADHRGWVEQGLQAPRVAVNVSAIQLRQRNFVAAVEQAIMEGLAPTGIDLEITESLLMDDVAGNIAKLKEVRALGVGVAIDDFGTGYSSLGYLAKLPVQTLKIDRSFIITMLEDPDAMTLVRTMISLAHSLRLKVVAEGVDAEEQAKFLHLLRCDQMQGYLFSKPLPLAGITALLQPAQ